MNWLIWKQHRKQFAILAGILALYAALVVLTGLHFRQQYTQAISGCNDGGSTSACVQGKLSAAFSTSSNGLFFGLFHILQLIVLAVPILLGIFWGVPLIANEYAEGTNKLIWTRSVSRRRWLTVKLIWILLAAAIFAGAFAALATWWSHTGNALYLAGNGSNAGLGALDRFGKLSFATQGITPAAYAFFMVAVGIAIGAWLKRILLALGITLGILAVVQFVVPNMMRAHYESAQTDTISLTSTIHNANILSPPQPIGGGAAWVISGTVVNDKTGKSLSMDSLLSNPPASCVAKLNTGPTEGFPCLQALGYHWSVQYQPAYKYWDFQRIEVGLYLALSLIPIGATYWLVLKRDA